MPVDSHKKAGLPTDINNHYNDNETASANDAVISYLDESGTSNSKCKKKRGTYHHYSPDIRLQIGRHASIYGNRSAVKKFTLQLNHEIQESTVRGLKAAYLKRIKTNSQDLTTLPHAFRGRPTKLGEIDNLVQIYIRKLRDAGGIVNKNIVIASAIGIVKAKNPSLLVENGGTLQLSRPWAESLLRRMNFVRRKGTKQARNLPEVYTENER